MSLTSESKFLLGILVTTAIIVVGAMIFFSRPVSPGPTLAREELLANGPKAGNPDASVYLVEFSDFQCPACAAFQPTINEIIKKHQDKLRFAYRHFPLDKHPYAMKAAIAAEAAAQQGKFWEMADLLFANQAKLSDGLVMDFAKQLGLRLEAFTQDLQSNTLKEKIEKDRADGLRFGVNATPTFFLNGQKLTLTSFEDLKTAVEKAINKI